MLVRVTIHSKIFLRGVLLFRRLMHPRQPLEPEMDSMSASFANPYILYGGNFLKSLVKFEFVDRRLKTWSYFFNFGVSVSTLPKSSGTKFEGNISLFTVPYPSLFSWVSEFAKPSELTGKFVANTWSTWTSMVEYHLVECYVGLLWHREV